MQKKISEAAKKRANLYESEDTTAFRVFNGEGDGIGGLTIDLLISSTAMVSWYSKGIYSFREDVYKALNEVVSTRGVYEQLCFHTNGQYVEQDDYAARHGLKFNVVVLVPPCTYEKNDIQYSQGLSEAVKSCADNYE